MPAAEIRREAEAGEREQQPQAAAEPGRPPAAGPVSAIRTNQDPKASITFAAISAAKASRWPGALACTTVFLGVPA